MLAQETTEMVHGRKLVPAPSAAYHLVYPITIPASAVRHAQTAAKVLFDSDYSSINVSDLLSALESDPKLVYIDKGEIFSVPFIKMGPSAAFFGSVCEFHRCSRVTVSILTTGFRSCGQKPRKIQWLEVE